MKLYDHFLGTQFHLQLRLIRKFINLDVLYPYNTQWKIFIGNSPNGDLQSFNWKRSLPACFATEKGSSWAKHEVGCELTSVARECSRQTSVLWGSVALWGCSRQANWIFNKLWQPQLGNSRGKIFHWVLYGILRFTIVIANKCLIFN